MAVEEYKNGKYDLVTNTLKRTFPFGTEVEVFSFRILEKAWQNAKKPSEREHVTSFIWGKQNGFNLKNFEYKENISHLRYTVDRIEDLELVKEIIKNINTRPILLENILNLYENNSKIFEINKNIEHDGYEISLKKDEEYLKSNKKEKTL
jgi:spore coat polysaccharide biosynthesis protein SpsF (cytidylyltransferase family)